MNLENPANFGLLPAVEALSPVVADFESEEHNLSRADIWAYAVLVAADVSQSDLVFTEGFRVGRKNCETVGTCSSSDPSFCAANGPDTVEDFPSTSFTTHQLLDYFRVHFGFNADETVAIMGAHTMGRALVENSGFRGDNGWVTNIFSLGMIFAIHAVNHDLQHLTRSFPNQQTMNTTHILWDLLKTGVTGPLTGKPKCQALGGFNGFAQASPSFHQGRSDPS